MGMRTKKMGPLPYKGEDPSSDPQSSYKSGHNGVCIFNPKAPKTRGEARPGQSTHLFQQTQCQSNKKLS